MRVYAALHRQLTLAHAELITPHPVTSLVKVSASGVILHDRYGNRRARMQHYNTARQYR